MIHFLLLNGLFNDFHIDFTVFAVFLNKVLMLRLVDFPLLQWLCQTIYLFNYL